ncbi:MAG TPA: DciA family protein [Rhodocyclaceae bacterium]|nr:DciA family protein [Rhodocyclaceae bacterium]
MPSRLLTTTIDEIGPIGRLRAHASRISRLQTIFLEAAPTYLTAAASVANVRGETVVLFAESSAISAKLRQLEPRLVEAFAQACPEVTEIALRVQVESHASPTEATISQPRRQLSVETRAALNHSIRRIGSESRLGRILTQFVDPAASESD